MSEKSTTLTIDEALNLAGEAYHGDRLPEAENIYQQILNEHPNQPLALHMMGLIAHQVGKNDIAAQLMTKAIAAKPDYADAHNNLGIVLQSLGKLEDAVTSCQKAETVKNG